MNSAINLGVEDMTATVVKYGLYLAAIFQVACLAAAIFVHDDGPEEPPAYIKHDSDDEDGEPHSSEHSTPQTSPRRPIHHRVRKQEKKKRR